MIQSFVLKVNRSKKMENLEKPQSNEPEIKKNREIMAMPDGTIADVTDMTPEERKQLFEEYNK